MPRITAPLLLLLVALCPPLRGAADPLQRYGVVDIRPSAASIYIGTVTMTMPPFVRRNVVYSSTYSARVFPYFFYSETGRIWISMTDDDLRRIDAGGAVDFVGKAVSKSGDVRKVEGRATPTGPMGGRIRVRVFVTKRIALTYDTTYELKAAAALPVTPR